MPALTTILRSRAAANKAIRVRRTQTRPLLSTQVVGPSRNFATKAPDEPPKPGPSSTPPLEPGPEQQFHGWDYIRPTSHVFRTFRKVLVFSSAVTVSLAILTLAGFEATHQWVEFTSIPGTSKEEDIWGWNVDQESWTGGEAGGTDPSLGIAARHMLRAAWMAQHWGTGNATISERDVVPGENRSSVAAYRTAEQHLAQVLAIARSNPKFHFDEAPMSKTVVDLLNLHAHVLEKIGTQEALRAARDEQLVLWKGLAANVSTHVDAARVASKIGDLSSRLKEGETAVEWWIKAIDYATLSAQTSSPENTTTPRIDLPLQLPPSPLAQRILISSLASLSAYYATTRQFEIAKRVESSAIRLLSSQHGELPPSSSITSEQAPAALHALFLQHRSSVFSIHLAEVLYATSSSSQAEAPSRSFWGGGKGKGKNETQKALDSLEPQIQLHLAAATSEHVAHALTNVTSPPEGSTKSALTHGLAPPYAKHPVLSKPAANLLRDARRTAAEAWNLSGMLYELDGRRDDLGRALECFERAVHWSGGQYAMADHQAQVVEKEWETYWKNYIRVKERLSR